jgi:tetratricopeptide (TPR) repeat protein
MNRWRIVFFVATLHFSIRTIATGEARTANATTGQASEKLLRIDENRPCDAPTKREYVARHRGIGFEILDSESEACFVPDQEYRLLDDLIDSVLTRTKYDGSVQTPEAKRRQAAMISKTISDVLNEHNFQIFVDTETLSDALIDRVDSTGSKRRIFDCDTGSFIFLTIAENLGAPVALVEIPIAGNNDHDYVRWLSNGVSLLEWDMNQRSIRSTPSDLPWPFGKSMTRDESLALALSLRPKLWQRRERYDDAIRDYQAALMLYGGATGYNNFAWLVATRNVSGRAQLEKAALFAAENAVAIYPKPNYRDTLACVYALGGNFDRALEEEEIAVRGQPDADFKMREARFKMKPPHDCTGDN